MTDPNTRSTLYLKNVLDIAATTINPVLYLSNGNKYSLPAVTLDPGGTAAIDINAALQNLGIASYAMLSGYVELDYTWPWVPVCATIRIVDVIHSTIFTYGVPPAAANSAQLSQGQPTALFGLWWKHNNNVSAFVSLANTSSQTINAAVSVSDTQGNVIGTHAVNVSPNGTKIVNLSELQQTTATEGGIQIAYTGPVRAIDVNGGIEDSSIGYSANLRFAAGASGSASSNTVAALGLMVGAADPMMLFPAGTTFTPYSVLRNIASAPIGVNPTLWWMQAGAAHSFALATLNLNSGQVQRLDLLSTLSAAGLSNFSGSVTLEFSIQGPQDGLLVQAGSVDQSGTYVFEVTPRGVAESAARSLGYWSTANGDDTMVSVWNPADEAQDFTFTISYSGGHYLLPIHLEARETRTFNMSNIIQTQVPDVQGNIIPASVQEGSARLTGVNSEVEHTLVTLDVGIYNVRKATCGGGCTYCDGYTSWYPVFPGSAAFAVQATKQFNLYGTWSNGAQYNIANSWSSSNTSVSSVNSSSGMATGVAGGSATITAFYGTIPIYTGQTCMNGTAPYCPAYTSGSQSGTGNVVQITGVNPSQITLGTSGVMTITGTNFNLLSSPVTVSTDGGVLVGSVVVQNTTTITATYNATNCSIALGFQNLWISGSTTDGGQLQTPKWPISVVLPSVSFSSLLGVVRGQTASVTATLNASSSCVSVSLSTTPNTTGSAQFSNGQSSMNLAGTTTLTIKGVTASSTANNIALSASAAGNNLATNNFTVIWVSISSIKTTGSLSTDDDAANEYDITNGTTQLNGVAPGRNGAEIKGVVSPSNFTDTIILKQTIISSACYLDTNNGSTPNCGSGVPTSYSCQSSDYTTCQVDDAGGGVNQDTTPAPSGNIYSWDTPGTLGSSTVNSISRIRQNFAIFAAYKGVTASNIFVWHNASSAKNVSGTITQEPTYNTAGDNQAGSGTTKTTYNLQ